MAECGAREEGSPFHGSDVSDVHLARAGFTWSGRCLSGQSIIYLVKAMLNLVKVRAWIHSTKGRHNTVTTHVTLTSSGQHLHVQDNIHVYLVKVHGRV